MPRQMAELILIDDESHILKTWAYRPKGTQRLATRARIVLACAECQDNKIAASRLGVCTATIGTWRRRFGERRPEGLVDEPRSGAPLSTTDAETPTSSGMSPARRRPSPRPTPTGA